MNSVSIDFERLMFVVAYVLSQTYTTFNCFCCEEEESEECQGREKR
jgi:hypothetical protein